MYIFQSGMEAAIYLHPSKQIYIFLWVEVELFLLIGQKQWLR